MLATQCVCGNTPATFSSLPFSETLRWDTVWQKLLFTGARVSTVGRLLLPKEMQDAAVVETSMLSKAESSLAIGYPFIFICMNIDGELSVAFRVCSIEYMPREALAFSVLHASYSYTSYRRARYDVPALCVVSPRTIISDYEEGILTLHHGPPQQALAGCTSFCFEYVDARKRLPALAAMELCELPWFALPHAIRLYTTYGGEDTNPDVLQCWLALCCKEVWDYNGVNASEVARLLSLYSRSIPECRL